jgi:hypothetical protein
MTDFGAKIFFFNESRFFEIENGKIGAESGTEIAYAVAHLVIDGRDSFPGWEEMVEEIAGVFDGDFSDD